MYLNFTYLKFCWNVYDKYTYQPQPYTDIDPQCTKYYWNRGGIDVGGNFSAVKKAIYIFCDFEICYAYNLKLDIPIFK